MPTQHSFTQFLLHKKVHFPLFDLQTHYDVNRREEKRFLLLLTFQEKSAGLMSSIDDDDAREYERRSLFEVSQLIPLSFLLFTIHYDNPSLFARCEHLLLFVIPMS
jgi:hypothetical protein